MKTPAKARANRRNSLKSTGPRTLEGKAHSSKNALRHGLLSRDVVLPGEDVQAFEAFTSRLHEKLTPDGPLEELLMDRITTTAWRLRRLDRVETGLFTYAVSKAREWERSQKWNPDEEDEDAPFEIQELGHVFLTDHNHVLPKLSRYEAALERSLYRALHELQRLQTLRLGGSVPPPLVVDVEIGKD